MLLKRFDSVMSSEEARLVGVKFEDLNNARYRENKDEARKALRNYSDYAIVMEVVSRIAYVIKLRDKWLSLSAKLTKVCQVVNK